MIKYLFNGTTNQVVTIVALVLLILLSIFVFIKKPNKLGLAVVWFALPVFVIGIVLHYIGLDFELDGNIYGWYHKFFYAFVDSVEMFGFDFPPSGVDALIESSKLYQITITVLHVIASLNSIYIALIIFFAILGGLSVFGLNGLLLGPIIVIMFFTIIKRWKR